MASNSKKYFWLKLKDDFFRQKEMKKLRKIAGGDTFTIIYLKLMLLSMKTDGLLEFSGIEETFAEELALEIDEDADNVGVTLNFLQKCGLIEVLDNSEILLTKVPEMTGKESESAERVRKLRDRKKLQALQCNVNVTKSNTEIETEIETDTENRNACVENSEITDKQAEYRNKVESKKLIIKDLITLNRLNLNIDKITEACKGNFDLVIQNIKTVCQNRSKFGNLEGAIMSSIKDGYEVKIKPGKTSKSEFIFDQVRFDRINKLVEVADVSALTNKDRDYYNKCQEYLRG